MKLLLDMNLTPAWCELFRAHGHEVVHWSTEGNPKGRCTSPRTEVPSDAEVVRWLEANEPQGWFLTDLRLSVEG